MAKLNEVNLAWGNVHDHREVFDRQGSVEARAVLTEVDDRGGGRRRVTNTPYRFSAAEAGVRGPAAYRGEHNYEALVEWIGSSPSDIDELHRAGVLLQDEEAARLLRRTHDSTRTGCMRIIDVDAHLHEPLDWVEQTDPGLAEQLGPPARFMDIASNIFGFYDPSFASLPVAQQPRDRFDTVPPGFVHHLELTDTLQPERAGGGPRRSRSTDRRRAWPSATSGASTSSSSTRRSSSAPTCRRAGGAVVTCSPASAGAGTSGRPTWSTATPTG